jgi:hypothetical protein
MSPEELKQLVKQHGKLAKEFEKDAIQIGSAYLIRNFKFSPLMEQSLDALIAPRKNLDYGIPDIRVFAKPKGHYLFSYEEEEEREIELIDLLAFLRATYPDDYSYDSMPSWWTEEDMLNEAEVMQPMDFAIWMLDHFMPADSDEEALLNTWLGSLKKELGDEIIAYKLDDDNDSNCAFAPYIFEGERCLILVIRYWSQL